MQILFLIIIIKSGGEKFKAHVEISALWNIRSMKWSSIHGFTRLKNATSRINSEAALH